MIRFLLLPVMLIVLFVFSCKDDKVSTSVKNRADSGCVVTLIVGKVSLNTGKESVSVGDKLVAGDLVATEAESQAELKINEKSFVKIRSNSVVAVSELFAKNDAAGTKFMLTKGGIVGEPDKIKNEESFFKIDTNTVSCGVRGTVYSVDINSKGDVIIVVKEGKVVVTRTYGAKIIDKLHLDKETGAMVEETINASKSDVDGGNRLVVESELIQQEMKSIEDFIVAKDYKAKRNKAEKKKLLEEINTFISGLSQKNITDKEWDYNENTIKSNPDSVKRAEDAAKEETPREPFNEKVASLGIQFNPKTTYVTGDSKSLIITNGSNPKSVICFNIEKSKVAWKYSSPDLKTLTTPAQPAGNNIAVITGKKILLINREAGFLVKTIPIQDSPIFGISSVTDGSGKIYIPDNRGITTLKNGAAARMENLPVIQSQTAVTIYGKLLVINEMFNKTIHVYDMKDGKVLFSSDKLDEISLSAPAVTDNHIFIGDNAGNIYKFAINDNFAKSKLSSATSEIIPKIVIKGTSGYFIAKDGSLYSFNTDKFDSVAKVAAADVTPDSDILMTKGMVISAGTVYYPSDTGKMLRLQTSDNSVIMDDLSQTPLISRPVMSNSSVYFVSQSGDIYRRVLF